MGNEGPRPHRPKSSPHSRPHSIQRPRIFATIQYDVTQLLGTISRMSLRPRRHSENGLDLPSIGSRMYDLPLPFSPYRLLSGIQFAVYLQVLSHEGTGQGSVST